MHAAFEQLGCKVWGNVCHRGIFRQRVCYDLVGHLEDVANLAGGSVEKLAQEGLINGPGCVLTCSKGVHAYADRELEVAPGEASKGRLRSLDPLRDSGSVRFD